jgi:uncharacterized membrane protein YqjE
MEAVMAKVLENQAQSRRETGTGLMFIGLTIWVADALVVFFLPAAMRLGSQSTFMAVIFVLALMGLLLIGTGYKMRGTPEE